MLDINQIRMTTKERKKENEVLLEHKFENMFNELVCRYEEKIIQASEDGKSEIVIFVPYRLEEKITKHFKDQKFKVEGCFWDRDKRIISW